MALECQGPHRYIQLILNYYAYYVATFSPAVFHYQSTSVFKVPHVFLFQMPWQSTENLVDPIYLLHLLPMHNGHLLRNQLIQMWNLQWIVLMLLLGGL